MKLDTSSIAIVGMACEFPGAHSPEELWQNILAGRRFFRKAPKERLPDDYFDPDPLSAGKSYCDQMAVLEGWRFDPIEFRIPPVVFHASDLAHWLALYTARAAIHDAGLQLPSINRARMGVVLGNTLSGEFSRSHHLRYRWPYVERATRRIMERSGVTSEQVDKTLGAIRESYESSLPEITEDSLAGNMANTIAGRICGYFDLGAGGYTVDGACSSSLLSIAHACSALVSGEMDVVLAGGVDISLDPFEIVGFAKARALAHEDIRPYDERADGMLPGEGCGLFVLMREADARASGHRIHALIRGWGISSDGAGGITAPVIEGQMRALRKTYERAGYPISSVGLIEGHGTGTSLGDKIEISAIRRLIECESGNGVCHIGSIKSQIGHCKAAAGAAGLTKAIMALKRKVLPPTSNCETPSSVFGQPLARLRPAMAGQKWEAGDHSRRASVSAMGFGGANSHVTLEEANPTDTASAEDLALLGSAQSSELILLSATTIAQLRQRITQLLPIVERICRAELTDLSAALSKEPISGEFRVGIVAESPWQLADSFRSIVGRLAQSNDLSTIEAAADGIFAGKSRPNPTLVALFPGQGSQRVNMGRHLVRRFPFARELYEQGNRGLSARIFRDNVAADENTLHQWESELRDTATAQPAIVLSSVAMLRVLEFFGLKSTVSIGHSLGEISALHAAGAFDAPTAIHLAHLRGQAMSSLRIPDPGSMLAVFEKPHDVAGLVTPFAPSLVISNYNSPRQTVVSGTSESIARFRKVCESRNIRSQPLAVSHAFHSSLVEPAAAAFRCAVESAALQAFSGRVISTSTGKEIASNTDLKQLLAGQIGRPVRFIEAVQAAHGLAPDLWIEIGPGGVLTSFVRDIVGADAAQVLATDTAGADGFLLLNRVLARAFVLGFPFATERLFAHRFHRPFNLENYHPVLIVNPCERPVELTTKVEPLTFVEGGHNAFLQKFAELYQKYHVGNPSVAAPTATGSNRLKPEVRTTGTAGGHRAPAESNGAVLDKDALLTFAIDWIVRRTGFPKSAITSEKKLRDDLNLDSIKVVELVMQLSRKAKRSLTGDPASVANAKLIELVERVRNEGGQAHKAEGQTNDARAIQFDVISHLSEWVRTFSVVHAPVPIERETARPLRPHGTAFIVGSETSPHVAAIANALRQRGLSPRVGNVHEITEADAPRDLATLVVVLPAIGETFFNCTATQFDNRIEGMATHLFQIFRWALAGSSANDGSLCGLVLRPVLDDSDSSGDLDAGAAFLKSVALEYPKIDFKWVSLPAHWSAEKWAELAIGEMEHIGRVAVAYSAAGERTSDVAQPLAAAATATPLALGPEDVVLVSGGGKGITFELVSELARATRCKLALFGSSPVPADGDVAEDELLRNVARLRQEGVPHIYVQADVTDQEAIRRAATAAEKQLGPITGVFHGAGITQLRLFRDKSLNDFLHCIRIKARGLYNILSVIQPEQLKILHVISSVLGNTGMRMQTDYAYANAWLDEAVRNVKAAHPHLHCLSLGYTVWTDTGLGKKIGALQTLRAVGITPVSVQDGVRAYRRLLMAAPTHSKFVITGRLTTDLESNLHRKLEPPHGRFLETLRRWVPGTEIVADAKISHATDLYLPEHVFEGTPMFPGVMAIEAMVQAAMACAEREDLPVLRNVAFRRPVIVPEDATVVIRTLALAEPSEGAARCIRVAMRSDGDDFQQNHFEAECWFGLPAPNPESLPKTPALPRPLEIDPEDLNPVPLFQGKLFRRIVAIRSLTPQAESLTDLLVPDGERYFGEPRDPLTLTPSPALRDAFLQSSGIALPPGYLPKSIKELRFLGSPKTVGIVRCSSRVVRDKDAFVAEYSVFSEEGICLEQMSGLVLAPTRNNAPVGVRNTRPIPLARVRSDLSALLHVPHHALALMRQREFSSCTTARTGNGTATTNPRQASVVANLLAARAACEDYTGRHLNRSISAERVTVTHRKDGKPELSFDDPGEAEAFSGIDLSLADTAGYSVALVAGVPVGVDVEPVETRNAEAWRGLLGDDGYTLALRLSAQAGESFDRSATRVWALLEAGKKASGLDRSVPMFDATLEGGWLRLCNQSRVRFYCAVLQDEREGNLLVLAIAFAAGANEILALSSKSADPGGVVQQNGHTNCPLECQDKDIRVIRLREFGIENCRLETMPSPREARGHAVIAVRAISVSYRDLQIARGIYSSNLSLPCVVGSEIAGEVVALDPDERSIKIGQAVIVNPVPDWQKGQWEDGYLRNVPVTGSPGLAAEKVCVPVAWLTPFARGLGYAGAATLVSSGITAWNALMSVGEVGPGQKILTLGTGSVSLFALQFAQKMGCEVIVTSSDDARLERARELGAHHTINYRKCPDWDQEVLKITNGKGVDLTVETGGVRTLTKSMIATKPGGRIAYLGTIAGTVGQVDAALMILKSLRIQGIYCGSAEQMRSMLRFIADMQIFPIIDRTFGFEDYASAMAYLDSGRPFGKVIVELPRLQCNRRCGIQAFSSKLETGARDAESLNHFVNSSGPLRQP